ncbi:hypothetical protein C0J52_06515 [Blattella germanica]|nr:hypothetical protein C0J52_06515 [Blattella germanica]
MTLTYVTETISYAYNLLCISRFLAARFSNLIKFVLLVATTLKTFLVYLKYPWCTARSVSVRTAFIKCAHCKNCICLDHAVIADLHILSLHSYLCYSESVTNCMVYVYFVSLLIVLCMNIIRATTYRDLSL